MTTNPPPTAWESKLKSVLAEYISLEEARDVVFRMYSAIRTTRRIMSDRTDERTRVGVAQMLIDLTYGIPRSPWIMISGGAVVAAFVSAVNGMFDGMEYANLALETPESNEEQRRDYFMKGLASSYALHDFAMQAMLAVDGPGAYRNRSRRFRDALMEIRDE